MMRSPPKLPASNILNSAIAPVVKSMRVQPVPQGHWVVIQFHAPPRKGWCGKTASPARMTVGEALGTSRANVTARGAIKRGSPATRNANPAGEEGNDG